MIASDVPGDPIIFEQEMEKWADRAAQDCASNKFLSQSLLRHPVDSGVRVLEGAPKLGVPTAEMKKNPSTIVKD